MHFHQHQTTTFSLNLQLVNLHKLNSILKLYIPYTPINLHTINHVNQIQYPALLHLLIRHISMYSVIILVFFIFLSILYLTCIPAFHYYAHICFIFVCYDFGLNKKLLLSRTFPTIVCSLACRKRKNLKYTSPTCN